jgi:E1A/CREB-binding protein
MFEAATNREEYYKLLAQKMYHIQKELEDRKNQKKPGSSKGMTTA